MKTKFVVAAILILFNSLCPAQNADLPSDFLSKEFHSERRQKLRDKLPANSVAVLFANAVRNRANDVDYFFHQDPDFLYLTGYKEPNSVLLIFKDLQTANNGAQYNEIIFTQARNARAEMWTGRRLGKEGVKSSLGFEQAFDATEFSRYNVNFSKFDQVLFFDFKNDVRDVLKDSTDLYDLIEKFKAKVNYPVKNGVTLAVEPNKNNLNTTGLGPLLADLRGVKTKEELELLRKAASISAIGHAEAMKAIRPGLSEREIQGLQEYVFKKYQAEDQGYPSIVGAGHNGCILHYMENYKPSITNKELILMDLAAEYHGYSADVTRTVPVNGKFSLEQKQIYELVLQAQEAVFKICKPGTPFKEIENTARVTINKGLKELGFPITSETERNLFYPHGCSHHIGLDVHDRGKYDSLRQNMVITVEPGIYIPENSNCDKKWWGISVRIEDDVLITEKGNELLSFAAPRTVKDIEELMKQPSAFDNFVLPELDKVKPKTKGEK